MSVFVDIAIGPNHTNTVATRRLRIDRIEGQEQSILDRKDDDVFQYRVHLSMGDRRQLTATFEHFFAEDVFALLGQAAEALREEAKRRGIPWD